MPGDVGRRRRKLRLGPDIRDKSMLHASPISTNRFHVSRTDYTQAYYMGFDGGCKADASCKNFNVSSIIGKCYIPSCVDGLFWCFKALLGRALGFMRCTVGGCDESKQGNKNEKKMERRRRRRRGNNVKNNVTTIKVNASPYIYDSHHAQAMEDCIEFVNSFYRDEQ